MILKPDTTFHVIVTTVGTQYTAILSLSLFHSFTKQTLLNTYCVSGIFIAAESTVEIR